MLYQRFTNLRFTNLRFTTNPSKEAYEIQAKKDLKSKQRRIWNPSKEGFEIHAKKTFEIHALPKVHQPKVHQPKVHH